MSDPIHPPEPTPTTGPSMSAQHRTHRVGSHDWSVATGGRLSVAERWRLVPPVLGAHLDMAIGRTSIALGLNRGRRRVVDRDALAPPSSILTRVAAAHAQDRLSPALLNHSHRTYAFGIAVGLVEGMHVDRELLFTSALLHDVALREGAGDGMDFTLGSAELASQICDDVGLPGRAAEVVMSAITMHHSPGVRRADGAVAYLLSAGAALDVIGLRAWDLPATTIAAVVEDHPREHFKREFSRSFRTEAARVPRGRAHFLERYAAFDLAIRLAPFSE